MKKNLNRNLVTLISLCLTIVSFISNDSLAQTFTTAAGGGNWATGSTWSGGTAPGNWANNTANITANVTLTSSTTAINGFTAINLSGGKSFTSGTSSVANNIAFTQSTFNVANGNIVVYGDLTLNDTDLTITTGSLTVTGTLTINYSSTVNISSGVNVTVGALSISNNNDAILNNNGSMTVSGAVHAGGPLNNTGTLQVNGNLSMANSSSALLTTSGTLNVGGSVDLPGSAKMNVTPSGTTIVNGSVNVSGNENLIVGTNANPPPYASMAIKGNLVSTSSGDITIKKNGRFAVFGNMTASGGGVLFTVSQGGQTYIHGNITMSGGGGNHIINDNVTDPYGLYVNGTISNSTGGSDTDSNLGNRTTMQNTNLPFYNWVNSLPNSPLPIELISFKVDNVSATGILLKWTTSMEKNFDYFELERADDQLNFNSIGRTEGKGGISITTNYDFTDHSPVTGKNYYRLKNVDLDGTFKYSSVIVADWNNSSSEIHLYPNPVVDNSFTIDLNDKFDVPAKLVVIDGMGNVVLEQELSDASTKVQLPQNLIQGIYVVKLYSTTSQKTIRIVVK